MNPSARRARERPPPRHDELDLVAARPRRVARAGARRPARPRRHRRSGDGRSSPADGDELGRVARVPSRSITIPSLPTSAIGAVPSERATPRRRNGRRRRRPSTSSALQQRGGGASAGRRWPYSSTSAKHDAQQRLEVGGRELDLVERVVRPQRRCRSARGVETTNAPPGRSSARASRRGSARGRRRARSSRTSRRRRRTRPAGRALEHVALAELDVRRRVAARARTRSPPRSTSTPTTRRAPRGEQRGPVADAAAGVEHARGRRRAAARTRSACDAARRSRARSRPGRSARDGGLTEASQPESILSAPCATSPAGSHSSARSRRRSPQRSSCPCSPPGRSSSWLRACALPALAAPARARRAVRRARAAGAGAVLRPRRSCSPSPPSPGSRCSRRSGRRARGSALAHAGLSCSRSGRAPRWRSAAWGRPDTVSLVVDGVLLGLALVAVGGLSCSRSSTTARCMPATTGVRGALPGPRGRARTSRRWCSRSASRSPRSGSLRGDALAAHRAGVLLVAAARLDRRVRLARRAARRVRRPRGLRGAHAARSGRKALALGGVAAALLVAVVVMRAPDPLPPGTPSAFVPPFAGHGAESPFEAKGDFVDANFVLRLRGRRRTPGARRCRHAPPDADAAQLERARAGVDGNARARRRAADRRLRVRARGPAFVDRYINFHSAVPENSYLGLFLQLGAAGILALLTVFVLLFATGASRVSRSRRSCSAAARRVCGRRRRRARARGLRSPSSTPSGATRRSRSGLPRSWSRLRRQRENVQRVA